VTGRKTWVAVATTLCGAVFGWSEWKTWQASRQALPANATDARRIEPGEAVLVLGCPLPMVQRWRVRIAVRSTDPNLARFVFSGAAVRGQVSEAKMMAEYAVQTLRVPACNVVVEDQSRTTVENIVNATPLMADSPAIKIASNTLHARRARQILRAQSPELAERLVRTRDYIPAEWGPLHAVMMVWLR
jgi:uncharacterized SAM-binding protein YcdF (DUF218 family)